MTNPSEQPRRTIEKDPENKQTMQYTLTGFTHDMGSRVFAFESIGLDRIRRRFRVTADLTLVRSHGIPVQELPLLCRGILQMRDEDDPQRAFAYTEADMCKYEDLCNARRAAAQQKKAVRRPPKPPVENQNSSWHSPKLSVP